MFEGVDLVAIGVEEAVEGVVHPPGDQSTESSFQVCLPLVVGKI